LSCAVAFILLLGCATDPKQLAVQQIAHGDFAAAVSTTAAAAKADAEDLELRAARLTTLEQSINALIARAASLRAAGDLDGAKAQLQQLLVIAPANENGMRLLLEIERDRRSAAAVVTAKELVNRGQFERASLLLSDAARDDPSHAGIRTLQQVIEASAAERRSQSSVRLAEERPISLEFRDANLRMVLEALTRGAGVNFVVDKDIRQDLRTTIFLRGAKLEDALDLLCSTNQLGKKVLDAHTILIYPATAEKTKEYQDLIIRAFYLSSAEPKQVASMLKSMLRIRDPYVDERLSLIVLRESPDTVRLAEQLVALLDVSEPEVMMEVEVLEIGTTQMTDLGIKYPDNVTLTPLGVDGATPAATIAQLSGLNRSRLGINTPTVTINLQREVDGSKLLANPRIRARNREKAKVLIGDKLPVITSTATSTGFVSESVQYIDVGLKLEVEPDVYLDDEVAIKVGLEVSSLKGTIETRGGSTAYQIGTRSANTVLRLRDGETQILAGLINRQESTNSSRIPGLGDLPILGRLFSSQLDNKDKTEIVLSITPHIVRNVRRPELYEAEFWSGTDNLARARPLRIPATPAASGLATAAAPTAPALSASLQSLSTPPMAIAGMPASTATPALPTGSALVITGTNSVQVGQEIALAVELSSEHAVRGLPLQIAFDKDKLQLLEIQEGAFFKQGNEATTFTQLIDAPHGTAQIGTIRNAATGAKGKEPVALMRFKALQPGEGKVSIIRANPIAAGEAVNVTIGEPHRLTIAAQP